VCDFRSVARAAQVQKTWGPGNRRLGPLLEVPVGAFPDSLRSIVKRPAVLAANFGSLDLPDGSWERPTLVTSSSRRAWPGSISASGVAFSSPAACSGDPCGTCLGPQSSPFGFTSSVSEEGRFAGGLLISPFDDWIYLLIARAARGRCIVG